MISFSQFGWLELPSQKLDFKRLLALSAACLAMAGCIPGMTNKASGTYVAKAANNVVLVQLVQTEGGHMTGHYEEAVLSPDGKITNFNALLVGVVDDKTLALTLQPSDAPGANIPMSASIQGSQLHLDGGANGHSIALDLHRSDEADFRKHVVALSAEAGKINAERVRVEVADRQAKAEQEAVEEQTRQTESKLADVQRATSAMAKFAASADQLMPKMIPAEQHYRDITQRMQAALAREKSIRGDGQAGVVRNQISMAINNTTSQTDQLRTNQQAMRETLNSAANEAERYAGNARADCSEMLAAVSVRPDAETWKSVCTAFSQQDQSFKKHIAALHDAFVHLDGVWASESSSQQNIVQASNVSQ